LEKPEDDEEEEEEDTEHFQGEGDGDGDGDGDEHFQDDDEEEEEDVEYFQDDDEEEEEDTEHFQDDEEEEEEDTEHFQDDEEEEEEDTEHFQDDEEEEEEDVEYFQAPPAESTPPPAGMNGSNSSGSMPTAPTTTPPVPPACPSGKFDSEGKCIAQEYFQSGFNQSYNEPAGSEFFQNYNVRSAYNNEYFQNDNPCDACPENTACPTANPPSCGAEYFSVGTANLARAAVCAACPQDTTCMSTGVCAQEHFQNNQPKVLKLFYADWCGHCQKFKPTFDKELPMALKQSKIPCKLVAVNADKNPELVRKYNVRGFPTVILETPNGRQKIYNGNRTAQDLIKFIRSNN